MRPLAAAVLLSALAGCAGTDLGRIDETRDERDDMPGPGIFAEDSGESALKWETGGEKAAREPAAADLDEQAEFELFKEWQRLRTEGVDSPEYREFRQWLEYRKFKAAP
jgi:hypothetical protein